MKILSLFDGMSCGQIALGRSGIKVDAYYASEIDKFSIAVTKKNFPDTIHLGNIQDWREWDIPWGDIGLLLAGSPCQGFSFAGKQLAFDDPRSRLFFTFCDILAHVRECNPKVSFLLENVKMRQEYLDVISVRLGVAPVFIDSKLVSAQRRQRYYWADWKFSEPEDKEISISSVIPPDEFGIKVTTGAVVGRRLDINGKRKDNSDIPIVQCLEVRDSGKSRCITTVEKDSVVSGLPTGRYPASKDYRFLTVNEREMLQTVPVGYTAGVSRHQRVKMLGNGWTVDVIAHILRNKQKLQEQENK